MTGMTIKDPIHGQIELDEIEGRIIDAPDFQRLRKIKQLATAHLVYPGANHTRFEHSLGTLHLASRICARLGLEKDISRKVRMHALLHDLGHIAFSHEAERVVSSYLGDHEEIGKNKSLRGPIGDIISENFRKKEISDFGKSPYAQIISSDIGADRMDYLKRDSYYTGVAYGMIDEDRIIGKMHFWKGGLEVEEGALEASESLLIARFMMFSTVYLHRTVRIASAMLERSLAMAIEKDGYDPEALLEKGDNEVLSELGRKKHAKEYVAALEQRRLYKEAHSVYASGIGAKGISRLEAELSALAKCDVLVDAAPNFFKLSGFMVRMDSGERREIGKISEIVRALKLAEESRKKVLVLAPEEYRHKVAKICSDYFG